MGTISRFEEIEAWRTARQLTNLIYKLSGQEKFVRDYGLKDQIRRAAVSVMSNIAEGFESQTQAQFIRYLGLAKASAGEARSQLVRFIAYLESNPQSRRIREDGAEYTV